MLSNKKYYIFFFLILLLFTQCNMKKNKFAKKGKTPGKKTNKESVVLVEVIKIHKQDMNSYILLNSTVETEDMVEIYPNISGAVKSVKVEEGDSVKKGGLLLKIDDIDLKLSEQKAKLAYQRQNAKFKYLQESFEKEIISEMEFEEARFAMQEAEVAWKQAQQNLTYTLIKSPIKGVISEKNVRLGERIQSGTKLFTILDTTEKIVKVFVPEKDISLISKDKKTIIRSEFLNSTEFTGNIKRISPVVDPSSGTFKVTISIIDEKKLIRPGMFVSVKILTNVHKNVVVVPKDSVIYETGSPYLFVIKDNIANKTTLNPGLADENYVESLEGLSEGDLVIIVGQNGLKDKSKVKVVKPESKSKKLVEADKNSEKKKEKALKNPKNKKTKIIKESKKIKPKGKKVKR